MDEPSVTPVSKERRSDPIKFFREILRAYFADNSWDETLKLWRIALSNGGPYPDDVLWCLDWVIAHRPPTLATMLYEDGWITLSHREGDAAECAYTYDEQLAWLAERVTALRAEMRVA